MEFFFGMKIIVSETFLEKKNILKRNGVPVMNMQQQNKFTGLRQNQRRGRGSKSSIIRRRPLIPLALTPLVCYLQFLLDFWFPYKKLFGTKIFHFSTPEETLSFQGKIPLLLSLLTNRDTPMICILIESFQEYPFHLSVVFA